MASKRNSRVYVDDAFIQRDEIEARMASHLSHRSSRSSLNGDGSSAFVDMGDLQRQSSISWESTSSSTSSSSGKDVPKDLDDKGKAHDPAHRAPKLTVIVISISASSTELTAAEYPLPVAAGRPLNFGVVIPGVYRSSYPKPNDYAFLRDLNLKTVM